MILLERRVYMKIILNVLVIALSITVFATPFRVGVMITGEIGGNAIYELVQKGALEAASDSIEVRIVEAGYNQSRWESHLRGMAATGRYNLLITFTEGMPSSVRNVALAFPDTKFVLLDGAIDSPLPNTYSVAFRDDEMTFLAGLLAGMITTSGIPGTNSQKTVGLIAGDTYPAMNNIMRPSYELGLKTVDQDANLLFGIVGSWSDPTRGKELASRQFESGADVILLIAGGSGIGAIEEAARRGKYVLTVDSNSIHLNPGVILASFLKHIDLLIRETITRASKGEIAYGTNQRVGIVEGMIDFTHDDPDYIKNVPEDIRVKMLQWYEYIEENGLPTR